MDAEPAAAPDETPILAPTRERYRPEYARIAAEMVKLGATRADLARAFGVSDESVRQWRLRHAEFAEALRLADAHVVAACEATLFEVAIGTTMEQTKVVNTPEGPARVKYIESLPPNVTALTKILTNRAPDRWGKDGKVELTGPNGTPLIPPGQEPDAERQRLELARKVGFMLGSALAKVRKAGERPDGLEILATAKDITPPDPAKPSHARAREAPSAAREMTGDGITALTVPKAPGPAYTPEHRETFEEMKRQAVERMRAKYGKQGGGNGE
jgi:transposase-like protein